MDLRLFMSQMENLGELRQVQGADWNLEIGTITELSNERKGPALLFDQIKGYPPGYRVVTNLIATPKRVGITLGFPGDISNVELARRIKDKFKILRLTPPARVQEGPVLENVDREGRIDLLKFPAPRWHELDGGRYLGTGDMVIVRDPDEGWVNVGTYRVQLHDRDTLGLYMDPGRQGRLIIESYWAKGRSCPVAVVFGIHPLVWMPSFLAFPWRTEEFGVAGGLLGEPLPVITGQYTGLPIPAHAEIAVEGDCPPPGIETRVEGPFGEAPGYYATGAHDAPVIKVKRIMHRNSPVITGAPPMRPPANAASLNVIRSGTMWLELEQIGIPGVKGVWNMRAGSSRFLSVVSIEQKYAGHATQVAMAVMSGSEGAKYGRFVIVVDDDIDPGNEEDVLWAMATRCDPATSMQIITGCWGTLLDPTISPERRAKGDLTNSRAIVLACRPFYWRKDFPKVNRASDELRAMTLKKWGRLFQS
ncbi:MAG: UbiD family decarboxylase [Chloroflexi bacterium]|nr:UbiD family decarboxylase [Chloroflexota bacterium]